MSPTPGEQLKELFKTIEREVHRQYTLYGEVHVRHDARNNQILIMPYPEATERVVKVAINIVYPLDTSKGASV